MPCSTRFSLSFTILLVFTAFQHVFLCLSMFPRFSLLYPLIFEFCYKKRACYNYFTRFCIFDRFYRLFLGFRPVSGISAHFSLFFNCFTGFYSVFNDFLPLCRFSGKKSLILCFYRLSAAIYAVLTSSTLFFRIIGRSPPFWRIFYVFAAFCAFVLFYGSIPYFSCSYEGFIVFCRISPVFSRFSAYMRSFTKISGFSQQ